MHRELIKSFPAITAHTEKRLGMSLLLRIVFSALISAFDIVMTYRGEGDGVLYTMAYTGRQEPIKSFDGLLREITPERGTFFKFKVYKRVRISLVKAF